MQSMSNMSQVQEKEFVFDAESKEQSGVLYYLGSLGYS